VFLKYCRPWLGREPDAAVALVGMVGSKEGWRMAPYARCPAGPEEIARAMIEVEIGDGRKGHIVPGLSCEPQPGAVDVMRGEETQLLGAVALGRRDGGFVLPGTHSKWVALRDGRIERFRTYLSGELFALLSHHGTLAPLVREPREDAAAFADGVRASGRGALSQVLFECRARVVAGDLPAASARDWLSGALIGTEWHDAWQRLGRPSAPVWFAALHLRAAQQLGVPAETLDAREAQLAAWGALARGLGHSPSGRRSTP
jgi:2-dehydro-3-deoxygalactonokinase